MSKNFDKKDELDELEELGYDYEQIAGILGIMNKYAQMPEGSYNYGIIERELSIFKITYQDIKSIFRFFYNKGQYLSVIRTYLKTNFEIHGNVSCEYNDMYQALGCVSKLP